MAQDQDAVFKVGRGGAGNFHSGASIKSSTSQPSTATTPRSPPPPASPSPYARAGRGGAGNFLDATQSSSAAAATSKEAQRAAAEEAAAATGTSVAASQSRATGLGGRGGAGNWKSDGAEARKLADEKKLGEELERQAREAVDQGLKMPEKAHHAPLVARRSLRQ